MTKKIELTKKQLTKLVQFATSIIHSSFTWESEAEDTVDDYLKAINYTHCCESDSELLLGFQKSEWFDLYEQGVLEYKDAIEKYLA